MDEIIQVNPDGYTTTCYPQSVSATCPDTYILGDDGLCSDGEMSTPPRCDSNYQLMDGGQCQFTLAATCPADYNPSPAGDACIAAQQSPTIDSFTPTFGSIDGLLVEIHGSNLQDATAYFGGAEASFHSISDDGTVLTVVAPKGAYNTSVDVTVISSSGETATANDQFTYSVRRKQILSVHLLSIGPFTTGDTVTLGFTSNDNSATPYIYATEGPCQKIDALTVSAGFYDSIGHLNSCAIHVHSDGDNFFDSANADNGFNLVAPSPKAIVDPTQTVDQDTLVTLDGSSSKFAQVYSWTQTGGDTVTLSDSTAAAPTFQAPSLAPGASDAVLTFTLVVSDDTQSSAPVTVTVTVKAPPIPPSITSISPNNGAQLGGDTITIHGSGFTAQTLTVNFGSNAATDVQVIDDTSLTAKSPAGGSGAMVDVTVTTENGTSRTDDQDKFTYAAALIPQIVSFTSSTPTDASVGGSSVVTAASDKGLEVSLSLDPDSQSVCSLSSPLTGATLSYDAEGTCKVFATASADEFHTAALPVFISFTVAPRSLPDITKLAPDNGPVGGGTTVTMTGTHLSNVKSVTIGTWTLSNASIHVVDDSTVTFVTPEFDSGAHDVKVYVTFSDDQQSPTWLTFHATALPTIDVPLEPDNGALAGGDSVGIPGSNFVSGGTKVEIGGKEAKIVDDYQTNFITVTTPPGDAVGAVDVKVTTLGGSATATGAFTYHAAAAAPVLSLQVSPGTFTQGSTAEVTYTPHAASGATSSDLTLTTTLPTNYTLKSYAGSNWNCTGTGTASVSCSFSGTISSGDDGTPLALTVDVPAASPTSVTFSATVSGGGASSSATGSELVSVAQVPASVTVTDGNNQSATVSTAFGTNLSVVVKDAGEVVINGASVTFTAPASGASAAFSSGATYTTTTDPSGIATALPPTANTKVGKFSVSAAPATGAGSASFSLTNNSGAAASFSVTGPSSASAGTAFNNLTITVLDAFANVVTGYVGTVSFSSNDALAVLPSNYQFSAGDNGTHSFSATLKTAGSDRTITATDTVSNGVTGTTSNINVSASTPATPVLAPTISHSGNAVKGGTITYTLTPNVSAASTTSATLTASWALPNGWTYNTASGTNWDCSSAGSSNSCTTTTPMSVGAGDTISLTVNVPSDATTTTTLPTVTMAGGGAASATSSGDATTVTNAPAPTVSVGVSPSSIKKGGTATVTVTLANTTSGNVVLNGVGDTVDLPSGVTIAATPNLVNACSGTESTSGAGATSFSLANAKLVAGASCHFQADVTSTVIANYSIPTGTPSSTESGNGVPGTSASLGVTADVPGAPTNVVATAGDAQASITFDAPVSDGGAAITTFTATSLIGTFATGSCAGPTACMITVPGLDNGRLYNFTVTATNSVGKGPESTASNKITPLAGNTVTFDQPADQSFGTSPTLKATASSGLTVSFASSTTSVCTITKGGVLTFLGLGDCTIAADQAGDATHVKALQVQHTFKVNAGTPVVSFTPPGTTSLSASPVTVSATGQAGDNGAVSFASSTLSVCTVSGTAVTLLAAGDCTLTATQAADGNWGAGTSGLKTFTVGKISQTVSFDQATPSKASAGDKLALVATATSSLLVQLSIDANSGQGVCSLEQDGKTVDFAQAGNCVIDAHQAGDGNYAAADPVQKTITVEAKLSSDATLSNLVSSGGAFVEVFDGATASYTQVVANNVGTITLTPTVHEAHAAVTVNDVAVSSGAASGPITVNAGANVITIVVTAQNQATKTYTITVTRAAPLSTNADLSDLAFSSGTPDAAFASSKADYDLRLSNSVYGFSVTPIAADPNATITVNGEAVQSGQSSQDIEVPDYSHVSVDIVVTAQDGTTKKTYTVTASKALPQSVPAQISISIANPYEGQTVDLILQLVQSGSLKSLNMFGAISPVVDLMELAAIDPTVAFFDNGVPIPGCASLPVVNGIAKCPWTATPGKHVFTATYGGKETSTAGSQSEVIAQIADQTKVDSTSVGSFLSDRANQIATNLPGMERQIDRLNAARQAQQGQGGGSNFAAGGKGDLVSPGKGDLITHDGNDLAPPVKGDLMLNASRLGSGPSGASITASRLGMSSGTSVGPTSVGDQDMLGFQSFLYNYLKTAGESGNFGQFNFSGPLDMQANFGAGSSHASFKASLSQMMAWQQQREQREMTALGFGRGGGSSSFMPLDIWTEGTYSNYSGTRSGQFGMATLGTDYVFSPSLLAGFYGQFDMMNQTSGTAVSGKGWMVGPYATARLGENVFWQARAGWGKSSNEITPTPAGADTFGSTRWLASSSLSGRWAFGEGWSLAPTASFTYFEDKSDGYVDHFGTDIPSAKTALGQVKLSPELSYGFMTENDLWIEPSLAAELIWNFASTNIDGLGGLDGDATGPAGMRGRVKAGLNFRMPSGISIGASGTYDGIGASNYTAIGGQATITAPF